MNPNQERTRSLLFSGLFAAITAVLSWINIPLLFTPVPVNLALIGPYMAGLLLGVRYGVFSQLIYVLLGSLGLPVFSGFTSGPGIIAGPTGGFIIGYILCAAACGLSAGSHQRPEPLNRLASGKPPILLMACGLAACYGCGVIWFLILTGSSLRAALISCVLPFLPGDAVKIAIAAFLSKSLKSALRI